MLYGQQPEMNFGDLYNHIRFYLWKRKIPPTQRSDDFVGWIGGKMNRVCCGAVSSSWTFPHWSGGSHGDNQPLPVAEFKMNTTTSCGGFQTNLQNQWNLVEFTGKIPWDAECVKRVLKNLLKWSEKSMTHLVALGKNTLCESEQTPVSVCGKSFYCQQHQDVTFLTIIAIFKNSATFLRYAVYG